MSKESTPVKKLSKSEHRTPEQMDPTTSKSLPTPRSLMNDPSFDRNAAGPSRLPESSDETPVMGRSRSPSAARGDSPNTSGSSLQKQHPSEVVSERESEHDSSADSEDDSSSEPDYVIQHQIQLARGLGLHEHVCVYCEEDFISSVGLSEHLIGVHDGEEDEYTCRGCGESFATEEDRDKHSETHSIERSLTCEKCGRCFRSRDALERHMKNHVSEFKCKICGKCLSSNGYLERHLRSHK